MCHLKIEDFVIDLRNKIFHEKIKDLALSNKDNLPIWINVGKAHAEGLKALLSKDHADVEVIERDKKFHYFHRWVIKYEGDLYVDHIDGNKLNNQNKYSSLSSQTDSRNWGNLPCNSFRASLFRSGHRPIFVFHSTQQALIKTDQIP
jgi:hypothetical protein